MENARIYATENARNPMSLGSLYNSLATVFYLPKKKSKAITFEYLNLVATADHTFRIRRAQWDELEAQNPERYNLARRTKHSIGVCLEYLRRILHTR